jgi:hypothetical protein
MANPQKHMDKPANNAISPNRPKPHPSASGYRAFIPDQLPSTSENDRNRIREPGGNLRTSGTFAISTFKPDSLSNNKLKKSNLSIFYTKYGVMSILRVFLVKIPKYLSRTAKIR